VISQGHVLDDKYQDFLEGKTHQGILDGFNPHWIPDELYDFQKALTEWAIRKGRSAIFADCGLGKTFMQLVWAENVCRETNGRVLILTPLAVAPQTVKEGEKIGVKVKHRREGLESKDRIVVTNYERLHYFDSSDFDGIVCDESSILKNFDGKTRADITEFMKTHRYRLLCTATAAPNDYIELGTSSEALGEMGFIDMISRFFKKTEKTFTRRDEHRGQNYRFRGHAERDFWRWVCSWARALTMPSDLGFDNNGFILPELFNKEYQVKTITPRDGYLFDLPAEGHQEQREELRRTISERCEVAAEIVNDYPNSAIVWCNLIDEGHLLEKLIPDSVEVEGGDTEEFKEKTLIDFSEGKIRVIITKPTIAGFGLNWQHCSEIVYFPSHSYEQYYQAVRRCWRFGQKRPVMVNLIFTDGQLAIMQNLKRKAEAATEMFKQLVELMADGLKITIDKSYNLTEEIPRWL